MEKNKHFSSRAKRNGNRGFTLVEIIVVLVIIAILAAVLIPSLTSYIDLSKEKSDMGQLGMLNRVTKAYRIEAYQNDPFLNTANTSDTLMGILVSENVLSQKLVPLLPKASFEWNFPDKQWVYVKGDGTIISLIFAKENIEKYDKVGHAGKWRKTDSGFSGTGLLFIPNPNNYYTITNKATLAAGTDGGYGVAFEATLDPTANPKEYKDTGYILQFDRGAGGKIIIKEKTLGDEATVLKIGNYTNPNENERYSSIIPSANNDPWWTAPHEVTLVVNPSSVAGKKSLSVYIDGINILDSYAINANNKSPDKFTGLRTWGVGAGETVFEEMTIK